MIIENTSAGPAFCEAAVPVRTKMPVPMIDPMPSAVRFHGPSDRRSRPRSASAWSSPNDFFVNSPIFGLRNAARPDELTAKLAKAAKERRERLC